MDEAKAGVIPEAERVTTPVFPVLDTSGKALTVFDLEGKILVVG